MFALKKKIKYFLVTKIYKSYVGKTFQKTDVCHDIKIPQCQSSSAIVLHSNIFWTAVNYI